MNDENLDNEQSILKYINYGLTPNPAFENEKCYDLDERAFNNVLCVSEIKNDINSFIYGSDYQNYYQQAITNNLNLVKPRRQLNRARNSVFYANSIFDKRNSIFKDNDKKVNLLSEKDKVMNRSLNNLPTINKHASQSSLTSIMETTDDIFLTRFLSKNKNNPNKLLERFKQSNQIITETSEINNNETYYNQFNNNTKYNKTLRFNNTLQQRSTQKSKSKTFLTTNQTTAANSNIFQIHKQLSQKLSNKTKKTSKQASIISNISKHPKNLSFTSPKQIFNLIDTTYREEAKTAVSFHKGLTYRIEKFNKILNSKVHPNLSYYKKEVNQVDMQVFAKDKIIKPVYIYNFTKKERSKFLSEDQSNVITRGEYIDNLNAKLAFKYKNFLYEKFGNSLKDEIYEPQMEELPKIDLLKQKKQLLKRKVINLLDDTEKIRNIALKE